MAQDVRPYKSKEQDGQGNEVIIRDQQLVEQTSQTTMASGEYFEIVDVDGRMAKIPKDNMINVVREALGSLLNGLADQTTVTKALTLNGDTLGASTAATLASVLGEHIELTGQSSAELVRGDIYLIASSPFKILTLVKPGYTEQASVFSNLGDNYSNYGISFTYEGYSHNTIMSYDGNFGTMYVHKII